MTEKCGSWATCMTDLIVMPDKHDKHAFFQTQTFLHLIRDALPALRPGVAAAGAQQEARDPEPRHEWRSRFYRTDSSAAGYDLLKRYNLKRYNRVWNLCCMMSMTDSHISVPRFAMQISPDCSGVSLGLRNLSCATLWELARSCALASQISTFYGNRFEIVLTPEQVIQGMRGVDAWKVEKTMGLKDRETVRQYINLQRNSIQEKNCVSVNLWCRKCKTVTLVMRDMHHRLASYVFSLPICA